MSNIGITPPDLTTATGKFRVIAGDTAYTALSPEVAGQGDYSLFSDDEIDVFLGMTASTLNAVGYGYLTLAAQAALEAKNVKDHDLQVDLTKRATELRNAATSFFTRNDSENTANGSAEFFTVVSTGTTRTHDELADCPYYPGECTCQVV